MGKAKRASKRARRQARGTAEEQPFAAADHRLQRKARLRRWVLGALPLLTFSLAAVWYWGLNDPQACGITLLLGGILFLMVALGTLGSGVQARDRHRSGSIDFGRRR
jgi:hypothetical protein